MRPPLARRPHQSRLLLRNRLLRVRQLRRRPFALTHCHDLSRHNSHHPRASMHPNQHSTDSRILPPQHRHHGPRRLRRCRYRLCRLRLSRLHRLLSIRGRATHCLSAMLPLPRHQRPSRLKTRYGQFLRQHELHAPRRHILGSLLWRPRQPQLRHHHPRSRLSSYEQQNPCRFYHRV